MRWLLKKGLKYVTVITDLHDKTLHVTENRGVESLACYLRSLSSQQREDIRTLSMDMNSAYISAARFHLPTATGKIVFDHFHVAKMLCGGVDKTRQMEIKRVPITLSVAVRKSGAGRVPG